MKKNFIKILIGVFFVIVVILWGLVLRSGLEFYSGHKKIIAFVELYLTAILAVCIQTIIHEFGHLIAGLISGYSFGLFRILSFTIGRRENKLMFYKESVPGTLGQCLMIPPKKDENKDFPVIFYLLGGVIINILIGILCLSVYSNISYTPFISQMLAAMGFVGIMSAFLNGLPMSFNDGMTILLIKKDKIAKEMFYNQLTMLELLREGKSYAQIPEDLLIIPENADYSNYLINTIWLFEYNKYQSIGNEEKAKELLEFILKQDYILDMHRYVLKIEKTFYDIIDNGGNIKIEDYLDKKTKRYMKATKYSTTTLKLNYLIERFILNDEKAAEKTLVLFEKALREFPYPGEVVTERRLLEDAVKKLTV